MLFLHDLNHIIYLGMRSKLATLDNTQELRDKSVELQEAVI